MRQVDARLALIRHALAPEAEPPRVSPLKRRRSLAEKMKADAEARRPITAEMREEYADEFAEREGVYIGEGLPGRCGSKVYHGGECCAWHVVMSEVGCVEFWAEPKREDARVIPVPTPRPVGLCSRCASVGHVVASCPFSAGDVDVMKVARLRRERRAGREAAA